MFGLGCKLTRDDISPALSALARTARRPEPVLRAMGTTFKSITEGTFNSVGAAYRPRPWKPKWGGEPSILQSRNPTLSKAFHITITPTSVTVGNPMRYAATHQFGAVIRAKGRGALRFRAGGKWIMRKSVTISPRPFFPIDDSGHLTPAAELKIRRAGERAVLRQLPRSPA
jgi:phage gpG-like protein